MAYVDMQWKHIYAAWQYKGATVFDQSVNHAYTVSRDTIIICCLSAGPGYGLAHEAICRLGRKDDGNDSSLQGLRSRRAGTNTIQPAPGFSAFPSEFADTEAGFVQATVSQTDPSTDSSFRHRQVQLLGWLSVLFVLVPAGSWWTLGAVWAARVGALCMVLSVKGNECTLTYLHRTDAAFGLLMDADQLKEAILAYLESKPCPFTCVKPVRGTYYRMERGHNDG